MDKLLTLTLIGAAACVGWFGQDVVSMALRTRAAITAPCATVEAPARDYERETVACMVNGGPCTSILYDYAQAKGQQEAINGTTRAAIVAGQIITRHMLDNSQ